MSEEIELSKDPIPPMSKEDLKKFILDFCDGKIFCSAQVPEYEQSNIGMIFMPLIFGCFSKRQQRVLELFMNICQKLNQEVLMDILVFFHCEL